MNRVRFSTLEIREYPMILGDHPEVSVGPPVTMDWEYQDSTFFSVEAFEAMKQDRDPKISAEKRNTISQKAGFTFLDIYEATEDAIRTKKNRLSSAKRGRHLLEEQSEKLRRKMQRWILRRPPSRALYDKWQQDQLQAGNLQKPFCDSPPLPSVIVVNHPRS